MRKEHVPSSSISWRNLARACFVQRKEPTSAGTVDGLRHLQIYIYLLYLQKPNTRKFKPLSARQRNPPSPPRRLSQPCPYYSTANATSTAYRTWYLHELRPVQGKVQPEKEQHILHDNPLKTTSHLRTALPINSSRKADCKNNHCKNSSPLAPPPKNDPPPNKTNHVAAAAQCPAKPGSKRTYNTSLHSRSYCPSAIAQHWPPLRSPLIHPAAAIRGSPQSAPPIVCANHRSRRHHLPRPP
jgi:hypothetical protein